MTQVKERYMKADQYSVGNSDPTLLKRAEFILVYYQDGESFVGEFLEQKFTQTHLRFPRAATHTLNRDELTVARRLEAHLD